MVRCCEPAPAVLCRDAFGFPSCRSSYQLDVDVFNPVAFELAPCKVLFHQIQKLFIYDVSVFMVLSVIDMQMLECVHIEVHLVV